MIATNARSQRYQSGFMRPSLMTTGTDASGIGGIGGEAVAIDYAARAARHDTGKGLL